MAASVGFGQPHLFPQVRRASNHARNQQAKGFFKRGDSGLESSPSPTQTSCFELARRRIGSRPDPRLRIEKGFQPRPLHRPIGQPVGCQHRNGQFTLRTPVALHRKALATGGPGVTVVTAVPMQPTGAASGTSRTLSPKTVRSNLNAQPKTRTSPQRQSQNPPEAPKLSPRLNPSPSLLHQYGKLRSVTQSFVQGLQAVCHRTDCRGLPDTPNNWPNPWGVPSPIWPAARLSKEEEAQKIVRRDHIKEGLVAVFSCVEPCRTYKMRGNYQTKMLEPRLELGKCLHLYFYVQHPRFGFVAPAPANLVPFPHPHLPQRA